MFSDFTWRRIGREKFLLSLNIIAQTLELELDLVKPICLIHLKHPQYKATEPMQCFIDEIMAGVYLPYQFKLSSNPFRKRNLRLVLSYLSLGILAPYLLKEWIFID